MANGMTVKQLAEYLQLSQAKVSELTRNGEIPSSRIGNQWRFDIAEVDAWMKGNANRAASSEADIGLKLGRTLWAVRGRRMRLRRQKDAAGPAGSRTG